MENNHSRTYMNSCIKTFISSKLIICVPSYISLIKCVFYFEVMAKRRKLYFNSFIKRSRECNIMRLILGKDYIDLKQ